MGLRETLIASRTSALEYAALLRAIPEEIAGIRGQISAITIFPIKSLGGLAVDAAKITKKGLRVGILGSEVRDRSLMLAMRKDGETKGGRPYDHVRFSQRDEPALVLAIPEFTGGDTVRYVAEGMPSLDIPAQSLGESPHNGVTSGERLAVHTKLLSDGEDVKLLIKENGPITAWVRAFLRKKVSQPRYAIDDVEVLRQPAHFCRPVEDRHGRGQIAETLLSDGGQILTASTSTLTWMNASLAQEYGPTFPPIAMEAFRPNLVIDGFPPNIEDLIDAVTIGDPRKRRRSSGFSKEKVHMFFGDMSVRCAMTKVLQETGVMRQKEPLTWLSKERPPRPDKPSSTTFAINTVFRNEDWGQDVRVGDAVEILSEKAESRGTASSDAESSGAPPHRAGEHL